MEEYNPDNPNEVKRANSGGVDFSKAKKIPIGRTEPFTVDDPKFKDKMAIHKKMGVVFKFCPQCKQQGLHDATMHDQLGHGGLIQGEVCDVCGYEDTHEVLQ